MTFGSDLWDQWRDVELYSNEGVNFMISVNEFMKQRAAIETQYVASLQKLVKPFKDELIRKSGDKKASQYSKAISESTVIKAWTQILSEAENEASAHSNIAERLETELRKTIKYQAQENDKKIREKFDDIRKGLSELQRQVGTMEKLREKFESEKKSMEAARLYHEKVVKNPKSVEKDIESSRVDAEKKALSATDAMDVYQKSIAETNEKKNTFYLSTLPNILNNVQTDDENLRIRTCRLALGKYHEIMSSQLPTITTGLDLMSADIQKITPEMDSDLLINLMRTGDNIPEDYSFEEKASVKEIESKTRGAQRRSSMGEDTREDDDASIFSMPPRKGRRAAVDRIKQIDKELIECERKKQAVECLIVAYNQKAAKDLKNLEELNIQRANLEIRQDNLGLSKHTLLSYIATIDKQPPPEMPPHLRGKTKQSLPQTIVNLYATSPASTSASSPSTALSFSSPASAYYPSTANAVEIGGASYERDEYRNGDQQQGESILCRARLLYDFDAAPQSQEISARAGDEVDVFEQQDDGWWRARLYSGGDWKEGYIPGNYTEIIS